MLPPSAQSQGVHQLFRGRDNIGHMLVDEGIASGTADIVQASRDGQHIPSILYGKAGRHEGTALGFGFHHHRGPGKARDDAVASQEGPRHRFRTHRIIRHQGSPGAPDYFHGQGLVLDRVYGFYAGGHDANGGQAALQGRFMRYPVGPQRQAAHNHRRHTDIGQGRHQFLAPGPAVGT